MNIHPVIFFFFEQQICTPYHHRSVLELFTQASIHLHYLGLARRGTVTPFLMLEVLIFIRAHGCKRMAPKLHPRKSAPILSPVRTDRGLDM